MSRGEDNSLFALCPYWSGKERTCIYCEGVEEGSRIRITFSDISRVKTYSREFCYQGRDWKKCRIAQMNEQKWKEFFENEKK